ncbi:hypothetical protein WKT02_04220 [Erysipelotrichaceae bacterium HCN-30851]
MSDKQEFNYTYSSKEQEELKKIRNKYIPKEEDKMDQLRKLDESTTRPGTIISLIVGIVSSLILGVGMCCTMIWADTLFVPGIIIGVIGIIGILIAYPLYMRITDKQRKKLAPEILKMTNELMH